MKLPSSKEEKIANERDISEFAYKSQLEWKFMKRLKSETKVRQWHIKVSHGQTNEKGKLIYVDYCISQIWLPRIGEVLYGYKATRSGRPENLSKFYFEKSGSDWLLGLEYLLKYLEGQDI